jgi:hypothetical protein
VFELSGVEFVGYVASALVVASLTMTSVVRLRMLSLAGATTFVVYGALIGSAPIVVTNGAIVGINAWFLSKELASGSTRGIDLGASHIRADSPFLRDFVTYHLHDIHRFQPDFELPAGDDVAAWLLTRDGLPAGLLIGRRRASTLTIDLDYVLGPYRDSRIGRWLFGSGADVFRSDGITTVRSHGTTGTHRRYLETVGFRPGPDPDVLTLAL